MRCNRICEDPTKTYTKLLVVVICGNCIPLVFLTDALTVPHRLILFVFSLSYSPVHVVIFIISLVIFIGSRRHIQSVGSCWYIDYLSVYSLVFIGWCHHIQCFSVYSLALFICLYRLTQCFCFIPMSYLLIHVFLFIVFWCILLSIIHSMIYVVPFIASRHACSHCPLFVWFTAACALFHSFANLSPLCIQWLYLFIMLGYC